MATTKATSGCRSRRCRSTHANCPDPALVAAARRAWDRALALGEQHGYRNAQATRARAHRHDRPGDGLRHHRHRARFRARQVQEARGRRLFPHHQPRRARGVEERSATARDEIEAHHPLRGRPRRPRRTRRRSTTRQLKAKGFTDGAIEALEQQLVSAFDIKFAFNKWTLGEEFCKAAFGFTAEQMDDAGFDMLAALGFTKAEIEAANTLLLRRHDARRRAPS